MVGIERRLGVSSPNSEKGVALAAVDVKPACSVLEQLSVLQLAARDCEVTRLRRFVASVWRVRSDSARDLDRKWLTKEQVNCPVTDGLKFALRVPSNCDEQIDVLPDTATLTSAFLEGASSRSSA